MKIARKFAAYSRFLPFAAMLALAVMLTLIQPSQIVHATSPTALTPVTLKQNNYAVAAGDLSTPIAPVAMDASNGNSFIWTGKEVLLVVNPDSATHTFTVTSVSDNAGRLDTTSFPYTVPAAVSGLSGIAMIEMTQSNGWTSPGNVINLTTSSALLKITVLRHQ